jgi:hypothetical protein
VLLDMVRGGAHEAKRGNSANRKEKQCPQGSGRSGTIKRMIFAKTG